jgi:hypothetical protein
VIVQLDESAPARLANALNAAGVRTLRFPNEWKGLKNGELLARLRETGLTCLVTCDKNLRYQQTIAASKVALLVLPRQRFPDLQPYLEVIAAAARDAVPGETIILGDDGTVSKA